MNDTSRLAGAALESIPSGVPDVVEWTEMFVRFPKSTIGQEFNVSKTPWIREPLVKAAQTAQQSLDDVVPKVVDYVKPVQCGGSSLGEALLCYWLNFFRGFLQYNWTNDKRAEDRWKSRIREIILACQPLAEKVARMPEDAFVKCELDLGRIFFRTQGVFNPANLDSDSITHQLNEELHSWESGHLQKAEGRQTAVWNPKRVNISNAGKIDSEQHTSFRQGTMQYWEVLCPGCRQFHRMQIRWDKRHPELGGLRYDADGCRYNNGEYDYNKLLPTIHYQMPCGYKVANDVTERQALSDSGRYSEPTNKGASLMHRSYTLEAVSVDYISWLDLIQEKHRALNARHNGNPNPWIKYVTERECRFYDPNDVPILGKIVLVSGKKKNRDGMPNRKFRFAALDRQQGTLRKGETWHWWMVIRDFDENGNSLLVYEGKVLEDNAAVEILREHEVPPYCVAVDSGDDTVHVYRFCLANGYHALKGTGEPFFSHPSKVKRVFSEFSNSPLASMLSAPLKFDPELVGGKFIIHQHEPKFILYSKSGIRDRLAWLQASKKWEVPEDVSEDYQSHMEGEELLDRQNKITGEVEKFYKQTKDRIDLRVCECYIAMLADAAGLIGAGIGEPATTQ